MTDQQQNEKPSTTRQQRMKLGKMVGHLGYPQPSIRVSDVDGVATVIYWLAARTYHEIVLTPRGRVLNDTKGTA